MGGYLTLLPSFIVDAQQSKSKQSTFVNFEFHECKVTKTYKGRCLRGKKIRLRIAAPDPEISLFPSVSSRQTPDIHVIEVKSWSQSIASLSRVHFMGNKC